LMPPALIETLPADAPPSLCRAKSLSIRENAARSCR
jgi:hypothetical protein